jgi:hypothetical protein
VHPIDSYARDTPLAAVSRGVRCVVWVVRSVGVRTSLLPRFVLVRSRCERAARQRLWRHRSKEIRALQEDSRNQKSTKEKADGTHDNGIVIGVQNISSLVCISSPHGPELRRTHFASLFILRSETLWLFVPSVVLCSVLLIRDDR